MSLFTAAANPGLIAASAMAKATSLRTDIIAAQSFYAWLSAQSDNDMTTAGVTASDLSLMRSMAADLNALGNVYHGLAPGGAYVLPYPFINSSVLVIGP
jgi:hypothetical protein